MWQTNNQFNIYGRKKGRKKLKSIDNIAINNFLLKFDADFNNKKIILDIGSGNGENTLHLAQKFPEKLIIACEVYIDGNLNLCNQLIKKKINNVKIFDQNILILIENINLKIFLDEIWILFPDPWPKQKHYKRRLINNIFFYKISSKLLSDGKIFIVTDSTSYFISILNSVYKSKLFKWINYKPQDWQYSNYNIVKTKFYQKALNCNRKSKIMIFSKI